MVKFSIFGRLENKVKYLLSCLLLLWMACAAPGEKKQRPVPTDTARHSQNLVATPVTHPADTSELEKKIKAAGLVDVQSVVPGVHIDLRYSTPHNFMGRDLYGDLERVYVQPDVAIKLKHAQDLLLKRDSSLRLLIFDGVRPLSIQKKMWDEVQLPAWKKGKFLSNPAYGSVHNYGAAVDLSLCTADGRELDMGTPYDDTATLAYPEREAYFLSQGRLTQQQVKNRQLLRSIMYGSGFFGIQTEWWHFNACTRDSARARYKLVE